MLSCVRFKFDLTFYRFPGIWTSVISQDQFNHEFLPTDNLDGLLQTCDNLSALDKLRIVLIWAKGMDKDCSRNEIQRIVSKYINPEGDPTKSLTLIVLTDLSKEFPDVFDIVIPSSLSIKIAAGSPFYFNPLVDPKKTRPVFCPNLHPFQATFALDANGRCPGCVNTTSF
jgi:hypothetical protein